MTAGLPRISGTRLLVDGLPFTVLAAETHNSASSTAIAIERSFAKVAALGANTVLAPVAWSLLEPTEGTFDFSLVDIMLEAAERFDLKLVPLWFGSWKNGMSSYIPGWVKRDAARFPRAEVREQGRIEHLSPFSSEARTADAAAFRAFMAHLREVDIAHTAIMVQVENEVGLLGDSRDRSELAQNVWDAAVPERFFQTVAAAGLSRLTLAGPKVDASPEDAWGAVLGTSQEAEETFMAYAYARYIDEIAAAGKAEHDIPMFVNVWLDSPLELDMPNPPDLALAGGMNPGDYPSGGPVPRMLALWCAAAPTLDFIAPDFYFGDFSSTMDTYSRASGGRLFIPEMRRSVRGVAQMFVAVGAYRAIGVSPFGVDSFDSSEPSAEALSDAYAILAVVADSLQQNDQRASRGFTLTESQQEQELMIGSTLVVVKASDSFRQLPPFPAYGVLVEESPGEILAAGRGFTVSFPDSEGNKTGIESASEIATDGSGQIVTELNGDESSSGASIRLHALGAVAPSIFPIAISTSSTGVVRIKTYTY
ncbi:hypothetical protein ASC66_11380 [Leifsonia sp. Root4]|uniref:DUF5597 domain-containing protein n=1 Tax=Leifsonia sp. Root4 TaxID=1736525 RepID=UPI0006FECD1A|nr:DUF5597 domain-containing protein [Leifsonia sp. Root4]KQW05580.1 hypothetical protein ASC66_11380 [Leifsonia sp. Root4]